MANTRISDESLVAFLSELGSDLPAPGGGAAAAVTAALGVSLCSMVANLTLKREKYAEYHLNAREVLEECKELRDTFLKLADEDAKAYSDYMYAVRMPKETEQKMTLRKSALKQAIVHSTQVPCDTIDACLMTLECMEKLHGRCNPSCVGDLAAGAVEIISAVKSAWLNILANLPYFDDRKQAEEIQTAYFRKVQDAEARSTHLYSCIESGLL